MMNYRVKQRAAACAALMTVVALLLLSGCGTGEPPVYPVKGKITFEGKPLVGGGSIAFVPLTAQRGRTAGGVIAEDGTYELTTHRQGDGSMAGEFRVVVTQQTEKEPTATPDGQAPAAGLSVPEGDRIPAVFSDFHQSPVKAKVEAKSLNEININLKLSDVPPPTRPPGARAVPPPAPDRLAAAAARTGQG